MIATGSLLLSLVVAATQVQAQLSGLGLSNTCSSAATSSLLSGDFATCAKVSNLLNVVVATGSVVQPLDAWIGAVCTSSPCSSSAVSSAQSTISSGCSSDVSSGNAIAIALNTITSQYTQVRDLLCLQATSNSSYCVTDTLNNIQTATGTNITVSEVTSLISGGTSSLVTMLNNVSTSAYCTDCGHAIFTKASAITANSSTTASSTASSAMSSKCGSSFVDGKIPSTVKQASTSSSSGASNSAAGKVEILGRGALVGVAGMLGAMVAGAAVLA